MTNPDRDNPADFGARPMQREPDATEPTASADRALREVWRALADDELMRQAWQ